LVFLWRIKHPEFADLYEIAREHRTEAWAEDIVEIADR
jgi:hypothetical protein